MSDIKRITVSKEYVNNLESKMEVIATKVDLLTNFNEQRIEKVREDIKDVKNTVTKLTDGHEYRIRTLEATQSYSRGVIGLALVIIGVAGATMFRLIIGV
tara:strand:+ start:212 stop:511 length:300 start_codon:yes stop_codon:yes gene_type:complete